MSSLAAPFRSRSLDSIPNFATFLLSAFVKLLSNNVETLDTFERLNNSAAMNNVDKLDNVEWIDDLLGGKGEGERQGQGDRGLWLSLMTVTICRHGLAGSKGKATRHHA